MEIIAYFLIICFEAISITLYFDTFFDRRMAFKKNIWTVAIVLSIGIPSYFVAVYLPANDTFIGHIFRLVIFCVIFASMGKLFFRGKSLRTLFHSACIYSLILVVDYICLFLFSFVGREDNITSPESLASAIVQTMCVKLVLYLVVLFIRYCMSKGIAHDEMTNKRWMIIMVVPAISLFSVIAIFSFVDIEDQLHPIIFMLLMSWLFVSVLIQSLVFETAKKEAKLREFLVINEKLKNGVEYVANKRKGNKNIDELCHDLRHHMDVINHLLLEQKIEQAKEYTEKNSEIVGTFSQTINTNHLISNAILNDKLQRAQELGISVLPQINDLSQLSITDEDLVVILSNLLDNAIEACASVRQSPTIILKIILEPQQFIISVKNTYESEIKYNRKKLPLTSKGNPNIHGIGTASVIECVNKYDGYYAIDSSREFYQFTTVIPI